MKILIYDTNIESLHWALDVVAKDSSLDCKFILDDPKAAESYLQSVSISAAFFGTMDKDNDLIPLAKRLLAIDPDLSLGFLVKDKALEENLEEAFPRNLVCFAHLPFSQEEFLRCVDAARARKKKKDIVFRTYVSFDFIVDGEVINFTSNKAKELLALLVAHNGGTLEMKETISRLWPGKEEDLAKRLYRDAVCRLRGLLRSLDLADMVEWGRGKLRLDIAGTKCDYFEDLKAKKQIPDTFLDNYPWGKDFLA